LGFLRNVHPPALWKIYEKYSRLLFDQRPLPVYGRVCGDMGAVSFEVQRIEPLGAKAAGGTDALRQPCAIQKLEILNKKTSPPKEFSRNTLLALWN
jgi:hypothetical protein